MPPTKISVKKLFHGLNLEISPSKIIECILYCRGKKMEYSIEASEEKYDITKLV
jgi:hypothetical protein